MSDDDSSTDNPVATITNNCDVDVDIYDVFNDSGADNAPLTYTKLGTVKKGATQQIQTIRYASQLQAMYTGPVAALSGQFYVQFPVAVIPIIAIGSTQRTSHTITTDEQRAMEQSLLFQKYVVANPDSTVAKGFVAALADPDQQTKVDAYFAAIKNFSGCSLESWTAVTTWTSQFTTAWQGTYYLYSAPPDGSSDPPKLVATLVIRSSTDGDTAKLTLEGSSASTSVVATGSDIEESNVGGGGLSVSLKPTWMNVVMTDGDGTDATTSYLIGAGMEGSVQGTKVFGTWERRTPPDSSSSGSPEDKEREKQEQEQEYDRTFSHITTIISLGVGLLTAYFFYKQLKNGHTQQSDKAATEAAKKPGANEKTVDSARQEVDKSYSEKLKDVPRDNPDIPKAQKTAAEQMPKAVNDVATAKVTSKLEGEIGREVDKLSDVMAERAPTRTLESVAEKLESARAELAAGRVESAMDKLTDVQKTIDQAAKDGKWKKFEEDALTRTKENAEKAKEMKEAADRAEKEQAERAKDPPDDLEVREGEIAEPKFDVKGE